MKTDFIYIDSIDSIDTSKVSVYDLNKRFIDSNGYMYGLRYNRATRKVEPIRLLRTTSDRAHSIKSRLIETKREKRMREQNGETEEETGTLLENPQFENEETNESQDTPPELETPPMPDGEISEELIKEATSETEALPRELETVDKKLEDFNPDRFITDMFEKQKLHRDRYKGIISNIQNSKLVTHENRERSNHFEEIIRSLEIDCFQKMDNLTSIYREITEYPRPVSHYVTHVEPKLKEIVTEISTDKEKYRFIRFYEIEDHLRVIYKNMLKSSELFSILLDEIEIEISGNASSKNKQPIADARFSLDSTVTEIKEILTLLTTLAQYIRKPENFIA